MADGQIPSAYRVEELQKAADHFASYALVSPIFFVCDDWPDLEGSAKEECAWSSLERFAQRAWRRPIRDGERERLRAFFDTNWAAGEPDEAVALTVSGLLQTPAFLFRVESGSGNPRADGAIGLTGWEMATRLSYFLWNSMPDAMLLQAAASGRLDTAEGVRAEARRMLDDRRSRDAVVHFHHQWLGTKDVGTISPARRQYGPRFGIAADPELDTTGDGDWPSILGPIRHSMEAETALFVERVIFDGPGTLAALFTDNQGYMSDHTAPIYGESAQRLEGPEIDWDYGIVVFSMGSTSNLTLYPASFPADQRAGILTLPSVLALGAYAVHPAPILRGKRILERIACQEFGSPPPGAEAEVPPDTQDVSATNRKRTEEATAAPACAGCHAALNPPGFAFENYDAMGVWRDEDNGLPVDASGTFALWSGETLDFEDGVDLAHQLSTSERVRDCYVVRWARAATGLHLAEDDVGLESLKEAFQGDDNIKELLVQIAGSDLFRTRRPGGE
jgi:hypothetical protein